MHSRDEIADSAVRFEVVAQLRAMLHAVAIAPPFALTLDCASCFEFGEDFQDRALCDAHLFREVAHA